MLPGTLFFTSVPSLYLEIESGPPRQGLSPTGLPPALHTCQWPVLLTVSVSQIPHDITLGSVNLLEQLTKLGNRLVFTRLLQSMLQSILKMEVNNQTGIVYTEVEEKQSFCAPLGTPPSRDLHPFSCRDPFGT